jgi:prepilin-type processing-associated H-X9-DG protein
MKRMPTIRTKNHSIEVMIAGSGSLQAFAFPDLLMTLAALLLVSAFLVPRWTDTRARTRQAKCESNLHDVGGAILSYSQIDGLLPQDRPGSREPLWWFYKELVKGELKLKGPSSPQDKVFACPDDRGYEDNKPFRLSAKFDYGSYVFNGVSVPGYPNIAGKALGAIKEPAKTLLVMEWTAHAPLSWHRSRTGRRNRPFYNDAENMVAFVDGHVDFIPIYYDGINPAATRDPIPGYKYKYSGD